MTLADFMLLIGFVPPPDDARSDMRRWRAEADTEEEFLVKMWNRRYPVRSRRSHRKAWPFVAKQESVVIMHWPPTRKSIKAIAPVIQLASRKRVVK